MKKKRVSAQKSQDHIETVIRLPESEVLKNGVQFNTMDEVARFTEQVEEEHPSS